MNRKRHQKFKHLQFALFGPFHPVKRVPGRTCPTDLLQSPHSGIQTIPGGC